LSSKNLVGFIPVLKREKFFYDIDSNSLIIRGIISLLIRILSGQKPQDIKNANLYFIDKIGMRDEFSPIHPNSLWKLINRMKTEVDFYETKIKK